jgi:hypothetical protein
VFMQEGKENQTWSTGNTMATKILKETNRDTFLAETSIITLQ